MRRTNKISFVAAFVAAFGMLMANFAFADVLYVNELTTAASGATKPQGGSGSVEVWLAEANGVVEGDSNGCGAGGGDASAYVTMTSDNTGVTITNPGPHRIPGCGNANKLTFAYSVSSTATGTANITGAITGGKDDAAFDDSDAFVVTITAAVTNTAPTVSVTGVTDGATYQVESVPAAGCSVVDAEDNNESATPVITGILSAIGLGTQTATCTYTDGGGITRSASATYTITDTGNPVITRRAAGDSCSLAGANGWCRGTQTAGFTATDTGTGFAPSGALTYDFTQSTSAEGSAVNIASGTVQDRAGNTGTSINAGPFKIDGSAPNAPTAAATTTADYIDGTTNWWRDTVTVAFTANGDNGPSGVDAATLTSNQTFTSTGAHNASGTVKDNAGNESSAGTLAVNVDATDPTVSFTGCPTAPVTLGSTQTAGFTAGDGTGQSGLNRVSNGTSDVTSPASLNTSSIGSKSMTLTAYDNVGNTAQATCSYSVHYAFEGFFAPVDNLPTRNTVKAGRAIPVKFKLGGDQGLDIFGGASSIKPNSAKAPVSTSTTCAAATTDSLESTLTAGGSSLQYDALTQTYTYVWKTETAWAGNCRIFELNLNDGSSHRFSIAALK